MREAREVVGVIARATRQPMTVCAASIATLGTLTDAPAVCISTAAARGPNIKAAGSLICSSRPPKTSEPSTRTAQRAAGANRASVPSEGWTELTA